MQCFFLINKRFFFVSFYFFFYIVHLYTSVNVCPFKKYIYGRPNNKQSAKNQSSIPITTNLIGSIIHKIKSGAPTQHWLFFITNNQSCVPANPEVGRKISYIEVQ